GRCEPVTLLEVDRVDLRHADERLDVDRPGTAGCDLVQFRGVDDDIVAVLEFVSLDNVVVIDFFPGTFVDALVPDPIARTTLELSEMDTVVGCRAVELDRYCHQPEIEGPPPDRSWHGRSLLLFNYVLPGVPVPGPVSPRAVPCPATGRTSARDVSARCGSCARQARTCRAPTSPAAWRSWRRRGTVGSTARCGFVRTRSGSRPGRRSEEHTTELQSRFDL